MREPIIMINGGPAFDRVFHEPSWILNKTYPLAVAAAGGVPLMPVDPTLAEDYCQMADGLILTGSISYAPTPELAARIPTEGHPRREVQDRALYDAFKKAGKPILGICLGLQEINLYQGGTLLVNFKFQDGVEHMMTAHEVTVDEDCFLYPLFGKTFRVNSRHNNCIGVLGEDLAVKGYSPDGIIEVIEHTSLPIKAVEWHPERMRGDIPEPPDGPDMTPLFKWLVEECKKHMA